MVETREIGWTTTFVFEFEGCLKTKDSNDIGHPRLPHGRFVKLIVIYFIYESLQYGEYQTMG